MSHTAEAAGEIQAAAGRVDPEAVRPIRHKLEEALGFLSNAGLAAYGEWGDRVSGAIETCDDLVMELSNLKDSMEQAAESLLRGKGFTT